MYNAICLDANVFIAGFANEDSSEPCRQLLERLIKTDKVMVEPGIVSFEVASVLRRKVATHEMSEDQMKQALNYFFEFPLYMEWQDSLLQNASIAAKQLRHKNIYDASYLAVAQLRNIPLITLDEELMTRGKDFYPQIWTVGGYLSILGS